MGVCLRGSVPLRVCVCVPVSPWVVIFTQSYSVTTQIINYSSSRERDSKRGSVTISDRKVGTWKFIVGYRNKKFRFYIMGSCTSYTHIEVVDHPGMKDFLWALPSNLDKTHSSIHYNIPVQHYASLQINTQPNTFFHSFIYLYFFSQIVTRSWTPTDGLIRDRLAGTHFAFYFLLFFFCNSMCLCVSLVKTVTSRGHLRGIWGGVAPCNKERRKMRERRGMKWENENVGVLLYSLM